MRTEVCVSECANTSCRWNAKSCKASEADRTLVYMRSQRRCEGYKAPKPEPKKTKKSKTAKTAAKATRKSIGKTKEKSNG